MDTFSPGISAALLLFLASFAPLCLGSLTSNDPLTASSAGTTSHDDVIELTSLQRLYPTRVNAEDEHVVLHVPDSEDEYLPDSDAVGVAQAMRLDAVDHPRDTDIHEAVTKTFEDGSRASILALFEHRYRSTALQNFFGNMRARLVLHYRFVRGRRVHGPFTPICHLTNRDNLILNGEIRRYQRRVQKRMSEVLLMPAIATDPARQLTVKEIVNKCGVPVPVSSANRHVLRQTTCDRCGPACVTMVALDLGCRLPPECDLEAEIPFDGSYAAYVQQKLAEYCSDKITSTVMSEMPKERDNWLYVIMGVNKHFTLLSNGQKPPALRRHMPRVTAKSDRELWLPERAYTTSTTGTTSSSSSSSSSSMRVPVGAGERWPLVEHVGAGEPWPLVDMRMHTGPSLGVPPPMTMREPSCGIEFQVTWKEATDYFASSEHTGYAVTIYPKFVPEFPTSPMPTSSVSSTSLSPPSSMSSVSSTSSLPPTSPTSPSKM